MKKTFFLVGIPAMCLLCFAGYLFESYWAKPPILKSSVILEYDPSNITLPGGIECGKPKKMVEVAYNVAILDCDGDDKVDKVLLLTRIFFVVESKTQADEKNSTELNQIRLWDAKEGRTCPDGKKDYGSVEADNKGVYRLWYCGTPEQFTGSYLSRDTGEGNRYQQEFEKRATK